MVRSVRLVACALLVLLTINVAPAASGGGPAPFELLWERDLAGWNRSSSPVLADIDSDGENELVVGHQDGYLRAYEADGSLKWAAAAVPGIGAGCRAQYSPSAIDSSPAVADLDMDGQPEVIVGVGSTWRSNQNGSIVVFDGATGNRKWAFTGGLDVFNQWTGGVEDGWCDGIYSTPAIGDVDGDGFLDVVFGSWDHRVYALDRFGSIIPGFPYDQNDTVWSSPALADIDGDGVHEIIIGGDWMPANAQDHSGGVLRAYRWTDGQLNLIWRAEANEVFHSSPAVGDLDNDGRLEVVIGTGNFFHDTCVAPLPYCRPGSGSDHRRVFAFHADDGSPVAGFPVSTGDTVWASPALGDLNGDGFDEIVVGSYDGKVYAWEGDGSLLWAALPALPLNRMLGSPVIADLDGDGDQDVAVGSGVGMALLDGRTGADLEEAISLSDRVSFPYSFETAPAIGQFGGSRVIVTSGFNTPENRTRLAVHRLPDTSAADSWPMFRYGPTRQGTASNSICGFMTDPESFCDVPEGRYYSVAVQWMVDNNITTGTSEHLFSPDRQLTRGQIVTFLWRQAGEPLGYPKSGFVDVSDSAFYASAVDWARATGITTGTTPTTFSPNNAVTRAQLVTLLWRRAGEPTGYAPHGFVDVSDGRYYDSAVAWAKAEAITTGKTATTFSPNVGATRGQAATLLHREVLGQ